MKKGESLFKNKFPNWEDELEINKLLRLFEKSIKEDEKNSKKVNNHPILTFLLWLLSILAILLSILLIIFLFSSKDSFFIGRLFEINNDNISLLLVVLGILILLISYKITNSNNKRAIENINDHFNMLDNYSILELYLLLLDLQEVSNDSNSNKYKKKIDFITNYVAFALPFPSLSSVLFLKGVNDFDGGTRTTYYIFSILYTISICEFLFLTIKYVHEDNKINSFAIKGLEKQIKKTIRRKTYND